MRAEINRRTVSFARTDLRTHVSVQTTLHNAELGSNTKETGDSWPSAATGKPGTHGRPRQQGNRGLMAVRGNRETNATTMLSKKHPRTSLRRNANSSPLHPQQLRHRNPYQEWAHSCHIGNPEHPRPLNHSDLTVHLDQIRRQPTSTTNPSALNRPPLAFHPQTRRPDFP